MGSAVKLRNDYSAVELRRLARVAKDVRQSGRLLSIAAVVDGMNRADAARIGGMDRQTLRDWAGPAGLLDQWSAGPTSRLSPEQQADLAALVEKSPDRAVDGVVRWRRVDLKRIIRERFGVDCDTRYVGKLLHKLARLLPHQRASVASGAGRPYCRGVQKNWSRTLKAHLCDLPQRTKVELWFQDEARIGNSLLLTDSATSATSVQVGDRLVLAEKNPSSETVEEMGARQAVHDGSLHLREMQSDPSIMQAVIYFLEALKRRGIDGVHGGAHEDDMLQVRSFSDQFRDAILQVTRVGEVEASSTRNDRISGEVIT